MSSRFKALSGKTFLIGQGQPQDITTLDAASYEGGIVYTTAGEIKYSDGNAWQNIAGSGAQGVQGFTGAQGTQGVQGDYGPGFTIIGSVAGPATDASLQTAFPSANIGEGVIDQSDDTLWIWDGTEWINVGSFRGVQGFQGPQGPQGMQGTIGDEGIQGERGYRGDQGVQGIQGEQGIQGDLGFQGTQGNQGPQASQGTQGIQGDFGLQGNQGAQGERGPQAFQGTQGPQGTQGYTGAWGGVTFDYEFNSATTNLDPGDGNLKINSTNFTTATNLYIDDEDDTGVDLQTLFRTLNDVIGSTKGYVKVIQKATPDSFVLYAFSNVSENTGYFDFEVTYVAGDATASDFIADPDILVTFERTGAQGIQGVQGPQGTQGLTGIQGNQGTQGDQGIQGPQGIQGTQGIQGNQGTQGDQGIQGPQGTQGSQGIQGVVGDNGGLTWYYDYDTSTNSGTAPTTNSWKIDNSDIRNATKLIIDDIPKNNYSNELDELFDYIAAIPEIGRVHV